VQETARGISYPEASDHDRIWEHFQTVAETTDDALGTVDARILAIQAMFPARTATVTTVVSGSGASSYSQAFTWPVSRFTQPPGAMLSNQGGTGSSGFYLILLGAPTTAGGTITALQRDGSIATLTSMTVHVLGMQMTSGSGFE